MRDGDETTRDRLLQTLDMYDFGVGMMAARLRRDHPDASGQHLDALLGDWLARRHDDAADDGLGTPVDPSRFR